ncbi:MAG: translation initiation factor IF-2, partial [Proteobacteria bacterium]|nr:translation initiation factor IF-2 [Pseudomonadota bacterium]
MSRVRIYELAKEAGMGSKALAEKLIEKGFDIKGHSSTVDEETAAKIRASVLQSSESELVEKRIDAESGGSTVIRRRATIIRRPKKAPEEEIQEEQEISVDQHRETTEEVQAVLEPVEKVEEERVAEQVPVEEAPVAEVVTEKQPEPEETPEEPEQKEEVVVKTEKVPAQEKPLRKGIARVIGTIDIPVEAPRSTPPVRKKTSRPSPAGRPAQPKEEKNVPASSAADQAGRAKKKGKRPVPVETESQKKAGKVAGWKSEKKDRKNMRVTRFGDDYDNYTKRGKRGKGKAKKVIQPAAEMKAIKKRIKVADTISVGDLAHRMRVKANEIIAKLMGLGVMATLNQALDVDTATLVAADFGYEVEQGFTEEIGVQQLIEQEEGGEAVPRPPVVTVMGHVDHGKTSILDAIRNTDVADGEAGGITQHIGAYHVSSKAGDVTFVDTPGHAAFTEMRSRGAQITDIVILVVAADDGVMDQTREAIHHAQAAEVPILVVVNKIDKDNADPDRVKRELADLNLSPEEWGGDTIYCETSAKQNIGIDKLMENIDLMAEMLELKADPNRKARGRVIEAKLDKGRGPVATILVQEGTLKTGDYFVVGQFSGKVRALLDYKGKPVKSAKPSIPVEVQGLNGVPSAGDEFVVVTDEKMAKSVSQVRALKARESELASSTKVSLDKLFEKLSEGAVQELRVILRADVQGTLEAFGNAAEKLSTDEVKVRVLHEGT